jgi:hypothetical protein
MSEDFEPLIEAARGGDEHAFRALVEPLGRELHAYAYRMLENRTMTPPSIRRSFGSDSVVSTRSTHRIFLAPRRAETGRPGGAPGEPLPERCTICAGCNSPNARSSDGSVDAIAVTQLLGGRVSLLTGHNASSSTQ